MELMRLDKFLAHALQETRSEVKKKLKNGVVSVNGLPEKDPGRKVRPGIDRITVHSQLCALPEATPVWLMFHKPGGCVTARSDGRHRTVMDFIDHPRRTELFPAGRLDIDTEGLLLLTNDGVCAHRLLSPGHHVEKTYFVRVQGELTESAAAAFSTGLDIGEKNKTLPAKLRILRIMREDIFEAEVTVCEGKFHQIRRMFAACGCEAIYLKRIRMAGLSLDEALAPGTWRELTKEETERLYTYAETDRGSDF